MSAHRQWMKKMLNGTLAGQSKVSTPVALITVPAPSTRVPAAPPPPPAPNTDHVSVEARPGALGSYGAGTVSYPTTRTVIEFFPLFPPYDGTTAFGAATVYERNGINATAYRCPPGSYSRISVRFSFYDTGSSGVAPRTLEMEARAHPSNALIHGWSWSGTIDSSWITLEGGALDYSNAATGLPYFVVHTWWIFRAYCTFGTGVGPLKNGVTYSVWDLSLSGAPTGSEMIPPS